MAEPGGEPRPRLMIRQMVLENFKSYAGTQYVGPFHKVSGAGLRQERVAPRRRRVPRCFPPPGRAVVGRRRGETRPPSPRPPCPQNFSAVVGPNGSGKSNVIDAMLFVFGRRAKQVRRAPGGAAAGAAGG
jgi:structural maintenance of chromosome 4